MTISSMPEGLLDPLCKSVAFACAAQATSFGVPVNGHSMFRNSSHSTQRCLKYACKCLEEHDSMQHPPWLASVKLQER